MSILSKLADLILPATTALSGVTVAVGLCACPFQSGQLQISFVVLSAATLFGMMAALLRSATRGTPYGRRLRYEFGLIPLALLWLALLAGRVQQVREGGARTQMINDGKNLGLAFHSFHDDKRHLATDLRDPTGASLLSWRVNILAYIDQGPLQNQFDLTKPWDSPVNEPLLEKMPAVYHSILFGQTPNQTPWQGFVGPGTAFEPGKQLQLVRDFPDGTSNTILVLEAQQHVPWSKPADVPYGPNIPLPPLGQPYHWNGHWPFCCPTKAEPRFLVCMADATVRMFSADIPEHRMRSLIVRNDGEPSDGWLPDQ